MLEARMGKLQLTNYSERQCRTSISQTIMKKISGAVVLENLEFSKAELATIHEQNHFSGDLSMRFSALVMML